VLYALPDEIAKITPALRRYLELIFVRDADSQEPPFLRGVYFTSSETQGWAIFARLRELGIPTREESWPDRAFFPARSIREKVFKETHLVTRANHVDRSESRKKAIKYAAGLLAVLIMLGFTVWGYLAFDGTYGAPKKFYKDLADKQVSGASRYCLKGQIFVKLFWRTVCPIESQIAPTL